MYDGVKERISQGRALKWQGVTREMVIVKYSNNLIQAGRGRDVDDFSGFSVLEDTDQGGEGVVERALGVIAV